MAKRHIIGITIRNEIPVTVFQTVPGGRKDIDSCGIRKQARQSLIRLRIRNLMKGHERVNAFSQILMAVLRLPEIAFLFLFFQLSQAAVPEITDKAVLRLYLRPLLHFLQNQNLRSCL